MQSKEIHFTVPEDRSAAGIMSANIINDGEEFAKDFYVYKGGKLCRKWFSHLSGWNHFWEGNDISKTESVYHTLYNRFRRHCKNRFAHIKYITENTSTVKHMGRKVWLVHTSEENKDRRAFHIYYDDYIGLTYSMEWQQPAKACHIKLGDELRRLEKMCHSAFLGKVSRVLNDAVLEHLSRNNMKTDCVHDIIINGRRYIFTPEASRGGVVLQRHDPDRVNILRIS